MRSLLRRKPTAENRQPDQHKVPRKLHPLEALLMLFFKKVLEEETAAKLPPALYMSVRSVASILPKILTQITPDQWDRASDFFNSANAYVCKQRGIAVAGVDSVENGPGDLSRANGVGKNDISPVPVEPSEVQSSSGLQGAN